jgi:molecular chaperone DnaK (HSP70)
MTPIKWFKLLLLNDEDIKRQDIRDSPQLQEAREALKKHRGRLTAVELVGKFLKKIWDHTYAELGKQNDIEDLPLRVAITIPAIWPAHASNAMKEAARLAGITDHRDIGETTLILVQEPEAGALSTLFHRQDHPLVKVFAPFATSTPIKTIYTDYDYQKDDSFVVCDAGGGTIVSDPQGLDFIFRHSHDATGCHQLHRNISEAFQAQGVC